ncbi:MAG: hypothetical protein WKG06_30375 [Segetibacter sp.]
MKNKLYQHFVKNKQQGQKSLAVLIDPDKVDNYKIEKLVTLAVDSKVDYLFVGGSLIISNNLDECIQQIKSLCRYTCHSLSGKSCTGEQICRCTVVSFTCLGA